MLLTYLVVVVVVVVVVGQGMTAHWAISSGSPGHCDVGWLCLVSTRYLDWRGVVGMSRQRRRSRILGVAANLAQTATAVMKSTKLNIDFILVCRDNFFSHE